MTKSELHYKKMTETPVARLIVTLGIPTTVSMLVTNIYNMADTYFVGTLGESAQGATGILFTLQTIIQAIALMLGHGSGTYVSKELAEKNTGRATSYVSSAFFLGGVLGIILLTLGFIFFKPLLILLGSTDTIMPYAEDYGFWVLLAAPLFITSFILNNNLRYEGKAVYSMVGLTSGGVLNILLDYIFVVKFEMGVYGAGMATAISQAVSFVILLIMFQTMAQSSISLRAVTFDAKMYFSIFKVGLPSLIRQGLTSLSNGILNNLTKPFGDAAIAAMSIANRYSSFIMCIALGVGQGFQPVSSFNYQVGKYRRVKKGLFFTMAISFIFILVISSLGFIFAEQIVTVFQKEPEVIRIGTPALRYASLGLLLSPVFIPVNMLYQSIRRSGIASALAILRSGAVLLPVLLIMSTLFGLTGIQMSQPISDFVTGIVSIPFIVYFVKTTPDEKE